MKIGQTIRDLRLVKARVTQKELADNLGITQTYLSQIENDLKEPSISVLKKVSEYFEIPLAVLAWKSIELKDIAENKKEAFNMLKPQVDRLLSDVFEI